MSVGGGGVIWLTLQNCVLMSGRRLAQGNSRTGRTGAGVHGRRGLAALHNRCIWFPGVRVPEGAAAVPENCVFTSSCSDLQMEPSVL
jgi:hypothetical protein